MTGSIGAGVFLFEPHGPADTGLVEWDPIDPSELESGTPVQRGHIYHQDPSAGYLTGVWDCTAFVGKSGPYPDDEFMFLLEGSLELGLPDGTEIVVKTGDAFVIPKGLEVQWKQSGYLRKFFMILSEPVARAASNPSLHRITIPDLNARVSLEESVETAQIKFVNSTGRMTVSIRDCCKTTRIEHPAAQNDLIHVLAGRIAMISNGKKRYFGPGETFYVTKGTPAGWQTEEGTRLLQSSYLADTRSTEAN